MSKKCSKGCITMDKCLKIINKKCTSDKILNPETNRCVSKKGILGQKLLKIKKSLNVKSNMTDEIKKIVISEKKKKRSIKNPIDRKYRKICDSGLVSQKKINPLLYELSNKLGEFQDVYCVANNNKALAALDFSSKGKTFLKKRKELNLINEVIDYANQKGIQYIHNTKKGGMYLKSIFFLPKNYNSALKLMYILWYPSNIFNSTEYEIAIGLLLDYNIENIIFFCNDKLGLKITKKNVKLVQNKLNKLKIKLEDLQKKYKIVHKLSIEKL